MRASVPRPLITMAIVAVTAPAFAQVQSSAIVAMSRTSATTRIDLPAAITSSQDLVFALQTPVAAALSIAPAAISSSASVSATAAAARTAANSAANGSTTTAAAAAATPTSGPNGALARASVTSLSAAVPAAAQATFTVSGEAGQAISVTVPQTVDLAGGAGTETALLTTTNNLADGPQFLGGTFAGGGTLSFAVGGQVTLASASVTSGELTGVMAVVAQYN